MDQTDFFHLIEDRQRFITGDTACPKGTFNRTEYKTVLYREITFTVAN